MAVVAGCYSPTIGAGSPCTSSSECPGDLACVGGTCGGSVDAAGPSDALADTMLDASSDANLQTIVIGDDPGELRDTEIWFDNPTTNFGGDNHFSVDLMENGLVWFDLTAVDRNLTVASAKLTLEVADAADEGGGTVTIHRLREAWVETEATWTVRATAQAWSVAGARSPASDATPLATFAPAATETTYDIALPAALIEAWTADPAMNFGLVFIRGTSTQHVHIYTRNSSGMPARLTITAY